MRLIKKPWLSYFNHLRTIGCLALAGSARGPGLRLLLADQKVSKGWQLHDRVVFGSGFIRELKLMDFSSWWFVQLHDVPRIPGSKRCHLLTP